MRADIHNGQEHNALFKGRIQNRRTYHFHPSNLTCNTRPVHTEGSFSTFDGYAPQRPILLQNRSHGDPIEETLSAIKRHAMKDAVQQTVDLWRGLLTVQS